VRDGEPESELVDELEILLMFFEEMLEQKGVAVHPNLKAGLREQLEGGVE
jgi:hypothetical protein